MSTLIVVFDLSETVVLDIAQFPLNLHLSVQLDGKRSTVLTLLNYLKNYDNLIKKKVKGPLSDYWIILKHSFL